MSTTTTDPVNHRNGTGSSVAPIGELRLNPSSRQVPAPAPTVPGAVVPLAPEAAERSNPEGIPARGSAHRALDPLTRRRDARGNRLPFFYAAHMPVVDDIALEQTALYPAIQRIAEVLPLEAGDLVHFYENRLRPALRRLLALRDTAEAELAARRDRAVAENTHLDTEEEEANRPDRAALESAEAALDEAHSAAARAVAGTGGVYDTEQPDPAAVLRVRPRDARAVAAELYLPLASNLPSRVVGALSWAASLIVGSVIGVSLGIMSKMLPATTPLSDPNRLIPWLIAGVAIGVVGKLFISKSAASVAERYWLGLPARNWGPILTLSSAGTLLLIVVDSYVEHEGLMAGARQEALAVALGGGAAAVGAHGPGEIVFLLASMILSFAYAGSAWWEGYFHGRQVVVANRVHQVQEDEFRAADTTWRAEERVQNALRVLADVGRVRQQIARLTARIAARTAGVDTRRPAVPDTLDELALRRIQDAHDNLLAAQEEFDRRFAAARRTSGIGRARTGEGFWRRLRRTVADLLGRPGNSDRKRRG